MNIIDIIILAILGFSLVSGMYKGFITSTLALLGFCASWIGAMASHRYLAAAIQNNDGLMNMLGSLFESAEIISNRTLANTRVVDALPDQIQAVLDQIHISGIQTLFQEKVAEIQAAAGNFTLSDCINETMLQAALSVFCFVVMFALIYAAVLLLVNLLNNVFRFPELRHFDWFCGGIFGLMRGAIVVLLIFAVIPAINSMLTNMDVKILDDLIKESKLAALVGDRNIVSGLLNRVMRKGYGQKDRKDQRAARAGQERPPVSPLHLRRAYRERR